MPEIVSENPISESLAKPYAEGNENCLLTGFAMCHATGSRWIAVGWTAISAPFRWSTWTGQPLGDVVIMEWERSEQPKEPVD
jgi:hypothetical protein